mmetsp:Transcript_32752/g.71517  ORF Transcript_32752/g.71517 Transcript_32752/m.71517 type:complete len:306 (+) Transcript_32752:344-1261(+)
MGQNNIDDMVHGKNSAACPHVDVLGQRQASCGDALLVCLLSRAALKAVVVHYASDNIDARLLKLREHLLSVCREIGQPSSILWRCIMLKVGLVQNSDRGPAVLKASQFIETLQGLGSLRQAREHDSNWIWRSPIGSVAVEHLLHQALPLPLRHELLPLQINDNRCTSLGGSGECRELCSLPSRPLSPPLLGALLATETFSDLGLTCWSSCCSTTCINCGVCRGFLSRHVGRARIAPARIQLSPLSLTVSIGPSLVLVAPPLLPLPRFTSLSRLHIGVHRTILCLHLLFRILASISFGWHLCIGLH